MASSFRAQHYERTQNLSIGRGLLAAGFAAGQSDKPVDDKPVKKGRGKFTISKETTYVTEPVDKDGYIDYARALNQRLRQGVTPENNANVLIWKALGPHPEGATMPTEFFQWLGMPAPPEKGEYFVDLKEYLKIDPRGKKADELNDRVDHVLQRPWNSKDHPEIALWLETNEKPLDLVVQATRRSHYFSPVVPPRTEKGPSGLISAPMSGVLEYRALAKALTARAMLRLGQGKYDDAWQDLLACHRLGRLVGRGATLTHVVVGEAIEIIISKAELAFLAHAKPDAKRLESCLRDLQKLPPLPNIAEKVNLYQRFELLDLAMLVDRYGMKILERLTAVGEAKDTNPLADSILEGIDWDPALRNANHWYDRLASAMREKDRATRQSKLDQIERDLKAIKEKVVNPEDLGQLLVGEPGDRGRVLGDMMICLIVPAQSKAQNAADQIKQEQDNLQIAFALVWYHCDHGHYPKTLADLAPNYLKQIPQDMFSGKPLIYRPSEKGFVLYSVGMNGKDDGGQGYGDTPRGDDLVVRIPLRELSKK